MSVDLKSLETLEKKIQRTVDLVTRLQDENRSLKSKLDELEELATSSSSRKREVDELKLSQQQLAKELRQLQDERRTVMTRVDGLLENLERLSLD